MFYLVIFILLATLACLNVLLADKSGNRILVGIAALLLIAVAGLRYETGGDWDTYDTLFTKIPPLNKMDIWHYNSHCCEIGFCILCSFIKWIGGDVQTLFFVVTTFNIILITLGLCRYTKYPVLGLLCYYGILYFSLEMIYIRQAMAVAICFYAVHCVEDKQPIRYALWVVLACLIHRMAIVMALLYPLVRIKFPMWSYIVAVMLGTVVMLASWKWFAPIFSNVSIALGEGYEEKFHFYTEAGIFSVSRKMSIGFILNLCLFGVALLFKKDIEQKKYGIIHFNMFIISLMLYYYFYELVEVSNRFRLFFLISIIALLPLIMEALTRRVKRLIAMSLIILYSFSFAQGIFLESPSAAAYNPYQNYLVYKIQNRPSTGKQRLEQSNKAFKKDRR